MPFLTHHHPTAPGAEEMVPPSRQLQPGEKSLEGQTISSSSGDFVKDFDSDDLVDDGDDTHVTVHNNKKVRCLG